MRTPAWFRQEIAVEAARVQAGTVTEQAAAAKVLDVVRAKRAALLEEIAASFVMGRIRDWDRDHPAPAAGVQLLFPDLDLPRKIELSPGRFKPLDDLTRQDWTAARLQARTKADNAAGYADALDEVYERVEPLLTDDVLTTAQALGSAA